MVVVGCGGGGEVGGEARRAAEAEMDGWVRLLDGLGAVEHPHRDFFFAESGNLFSVNSSGRAILNTEIEVMLQTTTLSEVLLGNPSRLTDTFIYREP